MCDAQADADVGAAWMLAGEQRRDGTIDVWWMTLELDD
jgi:hypothetical protein